MRGRRKLLVKRLGSALVMTLVIIVLITVVTVGYLASVMLETKTATSVLDQEKAYGFAMVGAHRAAAKVREALGPWDDPYKNFATNPPPFYWSMSPGRITRWQYSSLSSSNVALFSESSTTNVINLNRPLSDGSTPIIGGGTNAPDVSVKWVNLPANPAQGFGSNNPIVGRYAFWVDSESAKINLNTADGTAKYTTNSLGIGSPTEVSLQAVPQITASEATNIVQIARTSNFESPREILRAAGVAPTVFTNNVFSITAYSRSPELNVFGQPKMALLPLLGTAWILPDDPGGTIWATNMVINGITLRPGNEIYPTPAQLPAYSVRNPVTGNSVPVPWPLAFRAEATQGLGRMQEYRQFHRISTGTNYCYINGALLANYLAGTNSAGQPVTWPAFPSSAGANFLTKYSGRQIDSIVAQIVSLGSKLISSDYPHPRSSDYPGMNVSDGNGDGRLNDYLTQEGSRQNNAPFLFPGWLSGQFVNGMGRSIKLSGLRVKASAYGSSGILGDTNTPYIPPRASMDIWLEWWLPSGFLEDPNLAPATSAGMLIGHRVHAGALNSADISANIEYQSTDPAAPAFPFPPSVLPKQPSGFSYWGNQLLTNDQGIDFACTPNIWWNHFTSTLNIRVKDPDDPGAAVPGFPHDDYAQYPPYPATREYRIAQGGALEQASSSGFRTPLRVSSPMASGDPEFRPGDVRSVGSRFPDLTAGEQGMPMQTNAAGGVLHIGGGIAVRSQLFSGHWSDPDPVPLEAVRGAAALPNPWRDRVSVDMDTQEPIANFGNPDWQMVTITGETLRERVIKSVIPVSLTVSVPAHGNSGVSGPVQEVVLAPDDPLVNKFPGDWLPRSPGTIQAPPGNRTSPTNAYTPYNESQTSWYNGPNFDPDSYWLPQMDCGVTRFEDLPTRTRIPRSARMPNIGYLQYVRTGIIPDNESAPYETQHGTPFRLLNYAPSQNQTNYPDWALLDLLYVPSTLLPYGGRYNPSTNVPMTNNASTNLAFFGTYGGATAGRINPNGAVIYTTNVDSPRADISRTLPLQAVLNSVIANGANVPADTIAAAIEVYIRANGPLRIPAQICNVPAIATLTATNNPTRNDLVREIVGNLTTQDNVFSVWTVGQAIRKKPANSQYDEFQAGDNILAEVRLHFIVERYLDPGADGVYGNSVNRGTDTVAGTFDDPMDTTNHPFQPRYLYRVIASEEVR
jgi:hypothetical protein